uniref:Reverse transcriptase Ty1/copia-type domain-containing protein n=1 Tax=Chromera velia CCMP2878 TaxID=1169474 RepID=A0A0G4IAF6_9ALVE|eukprot:Cvel_12495.t1-p1 / transcript=Cvel_12495.t1 / gene=Cvel_12495 / organism=Chromera_velia_CCMP2878 / gene_product=hypothetical protein / transcript_product=hypothetical protein / location=Cvel_scaffold820:3026-4979(+) / protein_length=317 / sequence_SO=supercontig / SO=protein_coding / is_pseudo=false
MYGLANAPRLYTDSFRKIAKEEGWEELRESVFIKKEEKGEIVAVMVMHVDDLLIFAADPVSHFAPIQKRLKMDEPEELKEGESFEYIGMTLKRTKDGYEIGQKEYLESVKIDESLLHGGRLNASILDPVLAEEVKEELVPLMQKCTELTPGRLHRRPRRLLTALFLLSLLSARMWEADAPRRPPPPPDLEARHLLAWIGGFGGDINVALHSMEGNIPPQEAREGAGDAQNGGRRDKVLEGDDRLMADVDTSEQSPRDRPSRPPLRVPLEERFTRHPHPTQRWANPILAATAPAQRETAGSATNSTGPLFPTRSANNK